MNIFISFWKASFKNNDFKFLNSIVQNRKKIIIPSLLALPIMLISGLMGVNVNKLFFIILGISELFFIITMIKYLIFHLEYMKMTEEKIKEAYFKYQDDLRNFFKQELENNKESQLTQKYLKVLGLPIDTTDFSLIKKTYRKLISIYHPDLENGDNQKTKDIIKAFRYLDSKWNEK